MSRPATALGQHELREIAVAATTDPRTVAAYLAGKRVMSTTRARLEAALRALGKADLVRVEAVG